MDRARTLDRMEPTQQEQKKWESDRWVIYGNANGGRAPRRALRCAGSTAWLQEGSRIATALHAYYGDSGKTIFVGTKRKVAELGNNYTARIENTQNSRWARRMLL